MPSLSSYIDPPPPPPRVKSECVLIARAGRAVVINIHSLSVADPEIEQMGGPYCQTAPSRELCACAPKFMRARAAKRTEKKGGPGPPGPPPGSATACFHNTHLRLTSNVCSIVYTCVELRNGKPEILCSLSAHNTCGAEI